MKNKYAVRVKDNSNGKCWFAVKTDGSANVWHLVDSGDNFKLFEDKEEADKLTEFFAGMYEYNNKNGDGDVTVETLLMEGVLELGESLLGTKMKGMTPKESNFKGA